MSDSYPKVEPMDISVADFDPVQLESEILQFCLQYPNGVSHKIVEKSFSHVSAEQLLKTINRLSSLSKIDFLKSTTEPGTFLCRVRNASQSSITISNGSTTDQMEKTIYQVVKESGNLGIWTRDITMKTRLPPTLLNKTLKILESKKLIKAVKSVHANKRKVYMLYELTPDPTITGGTWYSDNEFEGEFVRILNEQCARLLNERLEGSIKNYPDDPFLRRIHSSLSSAELVSSINQMGVATISLTVKDIESILDTLIYDGKIEKLTTASTSTKEDGVKSNLYRSIKPMMDSTSIVRNPCGICPVFHDCHEDGLITPSTCIYLNNWLDF